MMRPIMATHDMTNPPTTYRPVIVGLLIALVVAFLPDPVLAGGATGKFDFYYQQIEEVLPLAPAKKPQGFWEHAKAVVQKGVNAVKKYSEIVFRRNLVPGEGSKMWYGLNSDYAYRVRRVKVRDEQHLLTLMGATNGDPRTLTDGQRALLELYRNAANPTLKSLSEKSLYPRIVVHLTDTTGFDDPKRFPKVEDDFWPMSMGFSITMPTGRYNYPGGETRAVRTFVHETAHCTNLTIPNYKGYGPDGHHSRNELTKPRSAFQEAWSQYHELHFDPALPKEWATSFKTIRIEDPKKAGVYETVPFTDARVTGQNLFSIEAVNAWIMYRLSTEVPDGRAKVDRVFFKQNRPWSSMPNFLRAFAAQCPADVPALARLLNEVGAGKLSAAEIAGQLRVPITVVQAALAAQPAAPPQSTPGEPAGPAAQSAISPEPPAPPTTVPAAALPVDPSADRQAAQQRYEEAYMAYVRAMQQQTGNIEELKAALLAAKAALK
jgi:hypothetical protein